MTKLEKVLLVLLILAVAADVALLVTDDDEEPRTQTQALQTTTSEEREASRDRAERREARTERARERTGTTPADEPEAEEPPAEEEDGGGPPRCADLDIPGRPTEAVTCRTASATLTIVDEAKPLLLGDTHVRVQSAWGADRRVTVRVRVRNETDAEQGVQAGGQELYLNLNGIRVDPEPILDERVPPQTGKTLSVRFVLTAGQSRVLNGRGRRAELGVRPWTSGEQASTVGVIRFFVRPGEPPS